MARSSARKSSIDSAVHKIVVREEARSSGAGQARMRHSGHRNRQNNFLSQARRCTAKMRRRCFARCRFRPQEEQVKSFSDDSAGHSEYHTLLAAPEIKRSGRWKHIDAPTALSCALRPSPRKRALAAHGEKRLACERAPPRPISPRRQPEKTRHHLDRVV